MKLIILVLLLGLPSLGFANTYTYEGDGYYKKSYGYEDEAPTNPHQGPCHKVVIETLEKKIESMKLYCRYDSGDLKGQEFATDLNHVEGLGINGDFSKTYRGEIEYLKAEGEMSSSRFGIYYYYIYYNDRVDFSFRTKNWNE